MKNSKCLYLSTHSHFLFLLLALALSGFYSANSKAAGEPTVREAYDGTIGGCNYGGQISLPACVDAQTSWIKAGYKFTDIHFVGGTTYAIAYTGPSGNYVAQAGTWTGIPNCLSPATYVAGTGCVMPPPNPCTAKTGKSAIPSGQIAYGENAAGTSPATARMCDADLCVIRINHGTTIPIGGGLQANYITNGTFTGERATGPNNCPVTVTANTPKDPDLPKPIDTVTPAADTPGGVPVLPTDCPAGSAFGSVNGVNVCSPSGSQIAYQPSTTTQTNNGTTTESMTQKIDTVNDDGSVTTKTTTTATSNGATSTTTTSGTNGRDGLDGKDGKGIDSIDLGVAPSAESGEVADPFPAPGSGVDGEGGSQKQFGVTAHFSGGGSCLADKSVTTPLGTWTIPLSQLCPWFDIMYKIISLVAVFAALRILVMA